MKMSAIGVRRISITWTSIGWKGHLSKTADAIPQQALVKAIRLQPSVRKRSIERVLHARPEVAELLGLDSCKTQSQNQILMLEYVTRFERVAEDLRGAYRICAGIKDRAEPRPADRCPESGRL